MSEKLKASFFIKTWNFRSFTVRTWRKVLALANAESLSFFLQVRACVSIQHARSCSAFVCCQLNHFVFAHSMPYCYVYLSDWLFYSGFWVNQSPSSSPSSSSSSFFGYCSHRTQCFRFPIPVAPTAIVHDVNTKAKSKLTWFMFQCAEVCSLCKIGSVLVCARVCLYVCLITRKAIIKHQCIHSMSEWNPNKFRAANEEQKRKKSEWSLNRER